MSLSLLIPNTVFKVTVKNCHQSTYLKLLYIFHLDSYALLENNYSEYYK